jgi:hypothetical protein
MPAAELSDPLAASVRRAWLRPARDLVSAVLVMTARAPVLRPGWDHYYVMLPLAHALIVTRRASRPSRASRRSAP